MKAFREADRSCVVSRGKLGWINWSSSLKSEVKDLFPDLSFLGVSSKIAGPSWWQDS